MLRSAYASLLGVPTSDRPAALAQTAQRYGLAGRFPGIESEYLPLFAHFALERCDTDRASHLSEHVDIRSQSSLALYRRNRIRIEGLPAETVHDEQHHRTVVRPMLHRFSPERSAINRDRLIDEVARWT